MKFNVGDQVKLVGIVKDSIQDKNSSRVSVLFGSVNAPEKEYWANEADLLADPPEGSAAAAAAEKTPAPTAHGSSAKH